MSEKQRKIKIIATGDPKNSRIIDLETGETLAYVTNVTIRMDQSTDFKAMATVEFYDVDVEVDATIEVEVTKSYRRLEPTER